MNSFEAMSDHKGGDLSFMDIASQITKDDENNLDRTTHKAGNFKSEKNPIVQIDFDMSKTDVKCKTIQIELFQNEMPSMVNKFLTFAKGFQVSGLLSTQQFQFDLKGNMENGQIDLVQHDAQQKKVLAFLETYYKEPIKTDEQ